MYQGFDEDIRKFNELYKLPSHESPQVPDAQRIENFMDILREEVDEGHEIIEKYAEATTDEAKVDILTSLSDWLGDIIVYAASEARRAGIPLGPVLKVLMDSNFSKLGEDGKPIYDDRGKVMKGPGYWRPEEKISEIISEGVGQPN